MKSKIDVEQRIEGVWRVEQLEVVRYHAYKARRVIAVERPCNVFTESGLGLVAIEKVRFLQYAQWYIGTI